jgi:hypothetical protein
MDQHPVVPYAELEKGNAHFALPDGLTVNGVILDDKNQPVPGAIIREGFGTPPRLNSEITTDPSGHFRFENRQPRQWIYSVITPRHAQTSTILTFLRSQMT